MSNILKCIKTSLGLIFLLSAFINAQSLNLSLGQNDHASSYESPDGDVVMMQIQLSATGGDFTVSDLTLNATSTLKRGDIVDLEIRIYEDKNNNGFLDTGIDEFIAADNYPGGSNQKLDKASKTVTIPDKTILNGTTQNWLIVNTFAGATHGGSLALSVTGLSASPNVVNGLMVSGNVRTIESTPSAKTGSLFVGPGGANPIARNVSANASNEVMLQLVLATSTLEGGTINQIDFDMSGNGNESNAVTNAKLYIDGDANGVLNLEQDTQIGTTLTGLQNNGVLSFSNLNHTIAAGAVEHWIVVYNFNSANNDFEVDLTSDTDVSVTGLNVSGAPANGNTVTISTTGSLILSAGNYNPTARTISATEDELEMIQINLAANATEDIVISSIGFKTTGTANEATDIDSALLILDANGNGRYDIVYDTIIDTTMTFSDNGQITFSSLSNTISAGTSEDWLLLYYLGGDTATSGETFKTYFDNVSQISATGVSSSNSISPLGLPVNGNTMTVSSTGTLTIAVAATNPGAVNFSDPATNLTMLAFTMTANDVEDINLSSITVRAQTNDIINSEITTPDIKIYEDVDKNGLLNVAVDRFITSQDYEGQSPKVPEPATIDVSGETIAASSSVQWLIVNTIDGADAAANDYIEVSILNTDISGTGAVSSNPANISGPNLLGGTKTCVSNTGTPGTLTLGEGPLNPVYRFISPGIQNESMLQFQLAADAVEDIEITEIRIITSGTGNESNDLTSVKLYLDGDDNGKLNTIYDTQLGSTVSSMVNNDTLTFTSFNDTISKGAAKNYIVVYNYNAANNVVGETFKAVTGNAYITATGIASGSTIVPTGGPANGEIATITDTGTLTVSAGPNNPGSTNVSNADNNVITIQLNVAAGDNEDVTISAFTFRLTGTFNDGTDFEGSSFRLYVDDNDNGAYDTGELQLDGGQTCSADNGFVTFTGFSETILAGTDKDYILLTNLNGNASNFENFRVSFVNSTDISATGDDTGNDIFPAGVPVQGGLFTVGTSGSLSLTTGSNNPSTGTENPSAQDVEILQLKLTASGVENINILSITFSSDGSHDSDSDISSVTLYQDVNNDGQLDGGDTQIGTGVYSGGTIIYSGLTESITKGTSENWLLVYDFGAGATNNESYRAGIYNASQIVARGATSYPITSTNITPTGFPVVSNYKTITTTGTMSVFAGDYNPSVANIDATTNYEMLQIKLAVSSIEDIQVDNLTITHIGTGDPVNDIAGNGVQLVRDNNNNGVYDSGTDYILASTSYSGTTATFTLAPDTISVDNTENWLVMYTFSSLTPGETFRARVANLTDIVLTGISSGSPITASGSVPISGGTMTVSNDFGLPVELTSFVATGSHGYINLKWMTESEINNLGFTLERKTKSEENFEIVESYSSSNRLLGNGTTSSQTEYIFNDSTVVPGIEYTYRLLQHDYNGFTTTEKILASAIALEHLPAKFELSQNYPNPFNPSTSIKIGLPEQSKVKITIYDILGKEVLTLANNQFDAGTHKFVWDGTNHSGARTASGLYFYVLRVQASNGKVITKNRKMIKLQ